MVGAAKKMRKIVILGINTYIFLKDGISKELMIQSKSL